MTTQPVVSLVWDSDTAGYVVIVDNVAWDARNGVGSFATRSEALEAWEASRTTELLAEIDRRRNDPEFMDRLDRIMTEHAPVLNRLEPHLGPIKIGCRRCGTSYDPTTEDHSATCRPVG